MEKIILYQKLEEKPARITVPVISLYDLYLK